MCAHEPGLVRAGTAGRVETNAKEAPSAPMVDAVRLASVYLGPFIPLTNRVFHVLFENYNSSRSTFPSW